MANIINILSFYTFPSRRLSLFENEALLDTWTLNLVLNSTVHSKGNGFLMFLHCHKVFTKICYSNLYTLKITIKTKLEVLEIE